MPQCAQFEPQVDFPRFLSRTIDHTIAATTAARARLMRIVASISVTPFRGVTLRGDPREAVIFYAPTLTLAVSLVASL